jgi:hypothetical protein
VTIATGIPAVDDVLAHALGRGHREDPVLPGSGGPAGNAQLTAWMGLLLLGLIAAELVTLISVRQLISWHIVVGVLLIPPALAKTAVTGWRMLRYYTGSAPYQAAGPPPMLLRLLGPLVVLSTLAVLGTGTVLVFLGQDRTFSPLVTGFGQSVNWLTLHQASFAVWAVATGLHVLARLGPSLRLARAPRRGRHDGTGLRVLAVTATLVLAAVLAWLVLGQADSWTSGDIGFRGGGEQSEGLAPG